MADIDEAVLLQREFPLLFHNSKFTEWNGYLHYKGGQIRLRMSSPAYPDLTDMTFQCSPNVRSIFIPHLQELRNCTTLMAFIKTVANILNKEYASKPFDVSWDSRETKLINSLLCELDKVVNFENILKVSDDFKTVTVKYTDSGSSESILQFQIPIDYPRGSITILEADLPDEILSGFTKICSIATLYEMFKARVESLRPFWEMCKTLEEKVWVIDPLHPTKKDVYRRILISDNLSVILHFNPLDITSCPEVKFLGSMKAIAEARQIYLKNLEEFGWVEEMDVTENITSLLGLEQLPVRNVEDSGHNRSTINCSICYNYLGDEEEPPAKLCSNKNCASWYHYSCLLQWLETVVTSVRLFDHISGPCPYCDTKLWCPLQADASYVPA